MHCRAADRCWQIRGCLGIPDVIYFQRAATASAKGLLQKLQPVMWTSSPKQTPGWTWNRRQDRLLSSFPWHRVTRHDVTHSSCWGQRQWTRGLIFWRAFIFIFFSPRLLSLEYLPHMLWYPLVILNFFITINACINKAEFNCPSTGSRQALSF